MAYKQSFWYLYLRPKQKQLVDISYILLEREKSSDEALPGYDFIIFPMAKAYEGFLKKVLLDQGLIPLKVYNGHRFRIGRALNPDVYPKHRDKYWLYDDLARLTSKEAARQLWDAWLNCRNRIFHYFPSDKIEINLRQAEQRLEMMVEAMDRILSELANNNSIKVKEKANDF